MRRWVETWLARLTEWIRELIPETGWCIFEWAICDFQWGDGSDSLILNEDDDNDNGEQERVTTDEERVLRESWTEIRLLISIVPYMHQWVTSRSRNFSLASCYSWDRYRLWLSRFLLSRFWLSRFCRDTVRLLLHNDEVWREATDLGQLPLA